MECFVLEFKGKFYFNSKIFNMNFKKFSYMIFNYITKNIYHYNASNELTTDTD